LRYNAPAIEEPPSEVFLRSLLQRKYQPLPESISLKAEFHGVYSIPDQWKSKIVRIRISVTVFI